MKVVLIDDDHLVCMSLKIILQQDPDVTVAATGADGTEALALYKTHRPDILLMDIRMKEMNGLDAAVQVLDYDKEARIIFLTTFADDEYIIQAFNIGSRGYLIKQDTESILPALKAVLSGQSVFCGDVTSKIPALMERSGAAGGVDLDVFGVTEREKSVVRLVAQGMNNKEIAEAMFLSEGTVRNYISEILDKLGLRDRTQLAVFYYQNQLSF